MKKSLASKLVYVTLGNTKSVEAVLAFGMDFAAWPGGAFLLPKDSFVYIFLGALKEEASTDGSSTVYKFEDVS